MWAWWCLRDALVVMARLACGNATSGFTGVETKGVCEAATSERRRSSRHELQAFSRTTHIRGDTRFNLTHALTMASQLETVNMNETQNNRLSARSETKLAKEAAAKAAAEQRRAEDAKAAAEAARQEQVQRAREASNAARQCARCFGGFG